MKIRRGKHNLRCARLTAALTPPGGAKATVTINEAREMICAEIAEWDRRKLQAWIDASGWACLEIEKEGGV
ncbi:MAG: hypothetical protein ABL994_23655 [Verrucomicrobiales bacterium]